jgi:predicted PurR-regulated permease PerM
MQVAERLAPGMGYVARVALTLVLVLAGVAVAWAVRSTLLLVLIAAVLAIGLDPAVRRLERLHVKRGWAVVIIFLAVVAFIALFALLVIPPLIREVRELASDIPGYITRLQHSNGWFGDLERKYHVSEKLKELTSRLPSIASASLGTILGITRSVASIIFNLLTIAILTVYFLLALPRGLLLAQRLFKGEDRERNIGILEESVERIGGYVSGNILVSVIAGVSSYAVLRILGVPFAAALGMWVAIADLIPTVGATLGAIVAVLVAATKVVVREVWLHERLGPARGDQPVAEAEVGL